MVLTLFKWGIESKMPSKDNENIIAHFLVSFDIFVLEKIRVDYGLDN